MNYIFSYHTRPARPLWKAVVYEFLRLICVVMTVAVVFAGSLWLVGGRV